MALELARLVSADDMIVEGIAMALLCIGCRLGEYRVGG